MSPRRLAFAGFPVRAPRLPGLASTVRLALCSLRRPAHILASSMLLCHLVREAVDVCLSVRQSFCRNEINDWKTLLRLSGVSDLPGCGCHDVCRRCGLAAMVEESAKSGVSLTTGASKGAM